MLGSFVVCLAPKGLKFDLNGRESWLSYAMQVQVKTIAMYHMHKMLQALSSSIVTLKVGGIQDTSVPNADAELADARHYAARLANSVVLSTFIAFSTHQKSHEASYYLTRIKKDLL